MERFSLHNHTNYSDGNLTPEKVVEEFKARQYKTIGITDHAFTEKVPRSLNELVLPDYIAHLRKIQKEEKGIKVKLGIEIDLSIATGTRPSKLPIELLNQLDYVLLEDVYNLNSIVDLRKKLSIPVGLAHYDDYIANKESFARFLAENDIFFEINTEHHRLPLRESFINDLTEHFKKYNVLFSVGIDFHCLSCFGSPDSGIEYVLENGLKFSPICF